MEQFVIVHRNTGKFYTKAGHNKWSSDESVAEKFDDLELANATARIEHGMVLPD